MALPTQVHTKWTVRAHQAEFEDDMKAVYADAMPAFAGTTRPSWRAMLSRFRNCLRMERLHVATLLETAIGAGQMDGPTARRMTALIRDLRDAAETNPDNFPKPTPYNG